MQHISSIQNVEIKDLLSLRSSRKRKKSGIILVEGKREIERALSCGFEATSVYVCLEKSSQETVLLLQKLEGVRSRSISEACYEKVAVRDSTDGMIVLFKEDSEAQEKKFLAQDHRTVLILDHIEKPGNIGALLRSADGSGIDAVIVIGGCDTFSTNVIRTSLGTVFHVPVQSMSFKQCFEWCQAKGLQLVLADPKPGAQPYHSIDWSQPSALVIGNEAFGISQEWFQTKSLCAMIPMRGIADSLNASVAGAIMMYEATKNQKDSANI